MENKDALIFSYYELLKKSNYIYDVDVIGDCLKLDTKFYFKRAESYLTLYIVFQDDGVCLSDSNEVYRLCDGLYEVDDDILRDVANELNLDYEDYRFTKMVTPETIEMEIFKFSKIEDSLVEYDEDEN